MLKSHARVEYVKMGDGDLVEQQDVIRLIRTISGGIECKIDVGAARKRTPKYKSNYNSLSESEGGRDGNNRGVPGRTVEQ